MADRSIPQENLELLESEIAQRLLPLPLMARIAVRPTWVSLIDFQTRLPSALGGVKG